MSREREREREERKKNKRIKRRKHCNLKPTWKTRPKQNSIYCFVHNLRKNQQLKFVLVVRSTTELIKLDAARMFFFLLLLVKSKYVIFRAFLFNACSKLALDLSKSAILWFISYIMAPLERSTFCFISFGWLSFCSRSFLIVMWCSFVFRHFKWFAHFILSLVHCSFTEIQPIYCTMCNFTFSVCRTSPPSLAV